jgi:futalosine hydrolase
MEGAALHFVALMENITFLQLRSVSNYVGERDKTKWDLSGAINNLNKQLQDLISQHLNHEV